MAQGTGQQTEGAGGRRPEGRDGDTGRRSDAESQHSAPSTQHRAGETPALPAVLTAKKRARRPHPRVLALLAVVVLSAAAWWYYTTLTAPVPRGIVASGTIESEEVDIASEVPGRVVQLPIDEGAAVKAGDVLVKLDDSLLRLQLETAALPERRPLELQLDKMTLRSPLDGVVGRRSIHVGEVVSPGSTLMVVTHLEQAELTLYVPEQQIGRVKVGQKVEVRVDSFPGESFPGEVTFINSNAEFTPRNVQTQRDRMNLVFAVKVKIPNPDLRLKPGMPADATIVED